MVRQPRTLRPEMLGLEDRRLLAASLVTINTLPPMSQQADFATVTLSRSASTQGPISFAWQVRLITAPSAAVGVNLPALDKTVTFAPGQNQVDVAVPITRGAPNPGEVDVVLVLAPVSGPPNLTVGAPALLRLKASADLTPPTVVASRLTSRGIELTFSEPMDVGRVQNINSYTVLDQTRASGSLFRSPFGSLFGGIFNSRAAGPKPVPLRAAVYDPFTLTVTLIPSRPLPAKVVISVTQGPGYVRPKPSGAGHIPSPLIAVPPLDDAAGNILNRLGSPGAFIARVRRG